MIKRGQLLRSINDIRDGLAWKVGYRTERYSERQTKGAMKVLRTYGMMVPTKVLGGTLITICNYDRFQTPVNYEGTNEGTNEGSAKVPRRSDGRPINNKNDKNVNNEKDTIKAIEIEFLDTFWPRYPAKVKKPRAQQCFIKARSKAELQEIMDGLEAYIRHKPADRAWAHASTWLNDERWADEHQSEGEEGQET